MPPLTRYRAPANRAITPTRPAHRSLPRRGPSERHDEIRRQLPAEVRCESDAGAPLGSSCVPSLVVSWQRARGNVRGMSNPLRLTIVYEQGDDGWIVASVPEVPGALSQGITREEARSNVIDALHGILELRFGEHALVEPAQDSEQLELVIAA
jgi:predicted RNase H-like HicB family nuclease